MKHVYMETFGCQMNVADTDRMELLLFQSGYLRTPHVEDADMVVVNTCSIREKAEQKVFSLFGGLKPLKQANPDLILGVAGCLAQQEQNILMNRIPHLDFIVGPDAVESIQQIVHRVSQGEGPVVWTEFESHKNYSIPEPPLIKDSSPSA
jgi:tRNA-2-methylthio-N6-dimethylallyladenosine synthase